MDGLGCERFSHKPFIATDYYIAFIGHYPQAENDILQQVLALEDRAPKTNEMRVALKAARRARYNARKASAKRYDGLPL